MQKFDRFARGPRIELSRCCFLFALKISFLLAVKGEINIFGNCIEKKVARSTAASKIPRAGNLDAHTKRIKKFVFHPFERKILKTKLNIFNKGFIENHAKCIDQTSNVEKFNPF